MEMEEIKEKLKSEIETADWDMLKVHHEKGAVFIVHGELSLIDAAYAIATDKVNFVKIWLDNKELDRPTVEEVEKFKKEPFKKFCDFVIVQPYVLIKLL